MYRPTSVRPGLETLEDRITPVATRVRILPVEEQTISVNSQDVVMAQFQVRYGFLENVVMGTTLGTDTDNNLLNPVLTIRRKNGTGPTFVFNGDMFAQGEIHFTVDPSIKLQGKFICTVTADIDPDLSIGGRVGLDVVRVDSVTSLGLPKRVRYNRLVPTPIHTVSPTPDPAFVSIVSALQYQSDDQEDETETGVEQFWTNGPESTPGHPDDAGNPFGTLDDAFILSL